MFAAGNVLHGAETADVAALSGRHAARAAARWLRGAGTWPGPRLPSAATAPLAWISPNVIRPGSEPADPPPRGRFALRSREFLSRPRLEVRQDGRRALARAGRRMVPVSLGAPAARLDHGRRSRGRSADGVRLRDRRARVTEGPWSTTSRPSAWSARPTTWSKRSEELGDRIEETRRDWEAKEDDPSVPGAQPDPDDVDQEDEPMSETPREESDQLPEEAPVGAGSRRHLGPARADAEESPGTPGDEGTATGNPDAAGSDE